MSTLFSNSSLFQKLKQPWLVSLTLVILLSIWLGLGVGQAEESPERKATEIPLAKVSYQTFTSSPTFKTIDLYGRTAPDRHARLGAEVAGKVVRLNVAKGDTVKAGQAIAQIDKGDLEIQLERASALYRLKQKEFKAAQSLKKRGLQGEIAYTTAEASLTEAKAMMRNAELALKNTVITSPFSGVVQDLMVELGDFVGVGDPVASVIDLDPLVIEADVSERHIQHLLVNQDALVRLLGRDEVEGRLRYVSRISSASTNTFPIEIEIDNSKGLLPAGVSAEVKLNLETRDAIKVTPAMLALDEAGNLGVKTLVSVGDTPSVKFVGIQLVKAEQDGVWLTGLGQKVDIITVGQGFVRDGDSVIAVEQGAELSNLAAE
ncbi:efflux RND transporter periplasmic adaptor subunit [Vibrio splendidus]|uniref:efflux RND transporter periplasmic adaptor subunit n=1 Tax=Vibrio splendidus TaxID=29497 RepID=UPI00021BE56D|nr:efflux RND transporter periplasmic adaptor subunit [Vibrio splendidus]EGU44149.1 membrane-fusion protein AcrA [Vibrio splendidus ATCC 33789]